MVENSLLLTDIPSGCKLGGTRGVLNLMNTITMLPLLLVMTSIDGCMGWLSRNKLGTLELTGYITIYIAIME